jgi:2',3'-cyclic-nucleotide 2'-phosphodiesterase (5'-nucleotidase family)
LVDAGMWALPKQDSRTPAQTEQRLLKARLIAQAFAKDEIDAMALGASDWKLGRELLQGLVTEHDLPVVAANLTCAGERPWPASRVVDRGGRRLGIIGVTEGKIDGCEVEDAPAAVQRAVAELGEVDATVLLLPSQNQNALGLVTEGGGIDFVVTANGRTSLGGVEKSHGAVVLMAGSRGKIVGVADMVWVAGAEGWDVEQSESTAARRVDGLRHRADMTRRRLEGEAQASRREAMSRQLENLESQIAGFEDQEAQMVNSDVVYNKVKVRELQLGADVEDHAEMASLLLTMLAAVEALEPERPAGSELGFQVPPGLTD